MQSDVPDADTPPQAAYPRGGLLLFLLMLAYMLSFVDRQILSLMVGPIRADLGISDFEISLLQGASFAIFYATLGVPLGWLADRYRRTAIVGIGAIVWSIATISCGLTRNFGGMFTARIGVGAGEAALSPSAYSLLADAFPPKRLARAMGVFVLALPLGAGLGFLVGGAVIAMVSQAHSTVWPVFGGVRAWQQVFIIVGCPGILLGIAIMALSEPKRSRNAQATSGRDDIPSLKEVLVFMAANRATYVPIFLAIMLLSIAGYAMLNWYPAFLARRFSLSIGSVGLCVGALYLVFGTLGTLGAPLVSEFFARKGYSAPNIRTVMWVGVLLAPIVLALPVLPNLTLTLVLSAPIVLLLNAGYGVGSAALQIITPNRMRGTVSALLILSNNLGGLAFGASLVPLLTDLFFHDDKMVGYALAIIICLTAALAALAAWRGLGSAQSVEAREAVAG